MFTPSCFCRLKRASLNSGLYHYPGYNSEILLSGGGIKESVLLCCPEFNGTLQQAKSLGDAKNVELPVVQTSSGQNAWILGFCIPWIRLGLSSFQCVLDTELCTLPGIPQRARRGFRPCFYGMPYGFLSGFLGWLGLDDDFLDWCTEIQESHRLAWVNRLARLYCGIPYRILESKQSQRFVWMLSGCCWYNTESRIQESKRFVQMSSGTAQALPDRHGYSSTTSVLPREAKKNLSESLAATVGHSESVPAEFYPILRVVLSTY
eukprot:2202336-Rhodomonas_salina.1